MRCLECGRRLNFWQRLEYYCDFFMFYDKLKEGYSSMNLHKDCYDKLIERVKNKNKLSWADEDLLACSESRGVKFVKMTKVELINYLKKRLDSMEKYKDDMDRTSWGEEIGCLITGDDAKFIIKKLEDSEQ